MERGAGDEVRGRQTGRGHSGPKRGSQSRKGMWLDLPVEMFCLAAVCSGRARVWVGDGQGGPDMFQASDECWEQGGGGDGATWPNLCLFWQEKQSHFLEHRMCGRWGRMSDSHISGLNNSKETRAFFLVRVWLKFYPITACIMQIVYPN